MNTMIPTSTSALEAPLKFPLSMKNTTAGPPRLTR